MLTKKSRISIREITLEPIEFEIGVDTPWRVDVLKHSAPQYLGDYKNIDEWAAASDFTAQLTFSKLDAGEDFLMEGSLDAQVPSLCARCGDSFQAIRDHKFRIFFRPVDKFQMRRDGKEAVDDVEYREIEGHFIDLVEVLAEQLILCEPMIDCPVYDELGKCSLCFKNPSVQGDAVPAMAQDENEPVSPFMALKGINLSKK